MSSLPLISHRLFVAAIGTEGSVPGKAPQTENAFSPPASIATAISLEVLNSVKETTSNGARPLRTARDRGSS